MRATSGAWFRFLLIAGFSQVLPALFKVWRDNLLAWEDVIYFGKEVGP